MSTDAVAERSLTYEEDRGKPIPSQNHAIVQGNLYSEFARHREYRTMPEVALELAPGNPKTPDLSVYLRRPVDMRRDVIRLSEAPLLAVEIVSPSQGMQEVMDKVEFYHAHDVKSVWVVVPPLRQITIFLPDGTQQNFHSGTASDPVIGLTADLDAVFS